MSDGKYFTTTKKGEVAEFRDDLRSNKLETRKEAVKKVIAAMTVGLEVGDIFPDMILCMSSEDIELKKLVYLYVINYARASKDNMETALLAVNTFVKDATGNNPLLRALAVRTMGCMRVDKITEYLLRPLRETLKDKDPYVRKTAALCVAKIYENNRELIEASGFIEHEDPQNEGKRIPGVLDEMVSDCNPMVVANAVAALTEMQMTSNASIFTLTPTVLHKLLSALGDCTDWGQVLILDAFMRYKPEDYSEAETIIDRVAPRLQHGNCAVVMSAVRVVLMFLTHCRNKDYVKATMRKLAPPIVTLLSGPKEIQYITLRNVSLIVQKRPKILESNYRVFFCKYNDPVYVKMEKLEVLFKLCNDRNIEEMMNEFKEYATEVDVAFVRKAVNMIGRCANKLEHSAQKCVDTLVELIKMSQDQGVSYVVQESIVALRDIYRRYPNSYLGVIGVICGAVGDSSLEPDAKAAMAWIVGEYGEQIEEPVKVLESLWHDDASPPQGEPVEVQMAMLVATVKLFLKTPEDPSAKEFVKEILEFVTSSTNHPDLRSRGYFYWRLLSADPECARRVILAERPEISSDSGSIEAPLLETLMGQIAMLASVFQKPPEFFTAKISDAAEESAELDRLERALRAGELCDTEKLDKAMREAQNLKRKLKEMGQVELGQDVEDLMAQLDKAMQEVEGVEEYDGPASGVVEGGALNVEAPAAGAEEEESDDDDLLGGPAPNPPAPAPVAAPVVAEPAPRAEPEDLLGDLGDLMGAAPAPAAAPLAPSGGGNELDDFFGGGGSSSVGSSVQVFVGCPAALDVFHSSGGYQVEGQFVRQSGFNGPGLYLYIRLTNQEGAPLTQMDMQFNKNSFGLTPSAVSHDGTSAAPQLKPLMGPAQLAQLGGSLAVGQAFTLCLYMGAQPTQVQTMNPLMDLQIAMQLLPNSAAKPIFFSRSVPLNTLFKEGVVCNQASFMAMWKAVPAECQKVFMLNGVGTANECKAKLEAANLIHVHIREDGATTVLYMATQTINNVWVLLEMPVNGGRAQVKAYSQHKVLVPFVESTFTSILLSSEQLQSSSDDLF